MKKILTVLLVLGLVCSFMACPGTSKPGATKVGVSMPTQSLQRWNQDGENLKKQLLAAGYEVDLQFANNEVGTQITQIESMIAGGCKVIVIAAIEGDSLSTVLTEAQAKSVKIIAYDRLISGTVNTDYYATFDNFKVGVLQGTFTEEKLGLKGGAGPFNVEFFAGDPGDNNAGLFFGGAMSVLEPYIKSGKLIVSSGQTQFAQVATNSWSADTAQARMETLISSEGYSPTGKKLDAVVCSNDSTAMGATTALLGIGYNKNNIPLITGQDCDIPNTQNMLAGIQSMSIFKDTRTLADRTVTMVKALMSGTTPEINDTSTYVNRTTNTAIPTYHCDPVICTNDEATIRRILIDSGYYQPGQIGL